MPADDDGYGQLNLALRFAQTAYEGVLPVVIPATDEHEAFLIRAIPTGKALEWMYDPNDKKRAALAVAVAIHHNHEEI